MCAALFLKMHGLFCLFQEEMDEAASDTAAVASSSWIILNLIIIDRTCEQDHSNNLFFYPEYLLSEALADVFHDLFVTEHKWHNPAETLEEFVSSTHIVSLRPTSASCIVQIQFIQYLISHSSEFVTVNLWQQNQERLASTTSSTMLVVCT